METGDAKAAAEMGRQTEELDFMLGLLCYADGTKM
jgi:hypothetical protein